LAQARARARLTLLQFFRPSLTSRPRRFHNRTPNDLHRRRHTLFYVYVCWGGKSVSEQVAAEVSRSCTCCQRPCSSRASQGTQRKSVIRRTVPHHHLAYGHRFGLFSGSLKNCSKAVSLASACPRRRKPKNCRTEQFLLGNSSTWTKPPSLTVWCFC